MDATHGAEVSGVFLSLQETEEIQRRMEKCILYIVRTRSAQKKVLFSSAFTKQLNVQCISFPLLFPVELVI